jgi:branched-chain amino acid transport system permease protein
MGELILQTCVNAVIASSFAAIFAVGLVLIFGIMQIVNFAHGELYMAGAYTLWFLYSENNLPFVAAVALAVIFVIMLGLFMEVTLFRWKRGDQLGGLILSVGALFVLQVLAVHFFGHGLMKNVIAPLSGTWHIFGLENVSLPYQRLVVLGVTSGLLAVFWVFMKRSKLGAALRACSQDPEAAQLQGINLNRIALLTMAISGGLAGAGGAVMAPVVKVVPNMGHSVIITALIVVIVGGIASLEGAVLAALLYSFLHTFVTTFVGGVYANILGLVLMLLVLVIRPTGIIGSSEKA